jgi:hypothetical protein
MVVVVVVVVVLEVQRTKETIEFVPDGISVNTLVS